MPNTDEIRCRLCLVTPADIDGAAFRPLLDAALGAGDVASLIITGGPQDLQLTAEALVPVAQAHNVAALVLNDTRIAGRSRADGVHVDSGPADLKTAIEAFRPDKIVGAGTIRTRHDAMLIGEFDPDYLFFGRLDGDNRPDIFPKALDLAAWWSSMFVVPAMVMGGNTLHSVAEAAATDVEFVALRDAIWDHPSGPAQAVGEANRILDAAAREAA
ncbi:MAG: thiamine phosphate synthase [Bauldia sp.]|uniref:thiamine phosphate synthase n=1 Tax=Bauldia sp. TaxID=2575872 RepID=UPI001D5E0B24|nr:thiamine phosphate synthase [Bauldia sp.]MCB1496126.1 thiamine phosphate synthase [Bauldia sp.]